ncbi:hypothetical protein L249_5198 [Ophiocordyceps polyrhachis-furcata BCC 54312]|uniref:Uncharacterized protein n=1 Tax=Ophiocordyceps polyrhachis-furcata BCC 54312 TaxID=1330021 RepID=A0A367L8V4_9HYPO|nr:hypothetical protein L249_5198 [Ophiocordyceps polyrhachis-furcata BCC 54312]
MRRNATRDSVRTISTLVSRSIRISVFLLTRTRPTSRKPLMRLPSFVPHRQTAFPPLGPNPAIRSMSKPPMLPSLAATARNHGTADENTASSETRQHKPLI